ncbi:MAG: T9SS type A sorting domain-containing protein [bacterium]
MKFNSLIQKLIFTILLLILCENSYSQGVTWGKLLNYNNGSLYKTQQSSDGGYIAVGEERIGIDSKIMIVKLDQYGDSVWSKYYDLNTKGNYTGYWVEETYDNGFIFSGSGEGPLTDAYLIKSESLGNFEWVKIFSTPFQDIGKCVKELPDKGFILLSRNSPFPNRYIVLTRTDSLGNTIWSKSYGDFHSGLEVQYIENSGFIVAGWRRFEQEDIAKLYLLRTNLDGDTLWTKMYSEFYHAGAYSIDVANDKGFIIGGEADTSQDFRPKAYIVKTDSLGNIQWQKRYANGYNETCYSIRKFMNNGYVFCGFSDSLQNGHQRGILRRIDLNGNILNEKYFRFGGIDNWFYSVEMTNDNGLILCGGSYTTINNNIFALMVKTDSTGNIYPVGINNPVTTNTGFKLYENYPNPFNPTTTINFDLSKKAMTKLIVYDVTGKEISTLINEQKEAGSHSIKFDGNNLPSGIYFYKLIWGEFEMVKSMALIK